VFRRLVSGLVIAESQLKSLLGLDCLDSGGCTKSRANVSVTPHIAGSNIFVDVWEILQNLRYTHWQTLLLSSLCIIYLLATSHKRIPKWVPSILILMIITTIVSYGANFQSFGIVVVGKVPSGLPTPTLPTWYTLLISLLWLLKMERKCVLGTGKIFTQCCLAVPSSHLSATLATSYNDLLVLFVRFEIDSNLFSGVTQALGRQMGAIHGYKIDNNIE
jgi:hypothetical protein